MQKLYETSYLGTSAYVTPLTLECISFGDRRVVPLGRVQRIRAAMRLVAGVHVEGGPFAWTQMVPVGLGDKDSLVRAVVDAQQQAPTSPTLVASYVGGHGLPGVARGQELLVFFDQEQIVLQADSWRSAVPYATVTTLELGGPGETSSNAGVVGGGFGLFGALAGMAMASAANAATSRKSVDTLVTWRTPESEVILHTTSVGPDELRVELSEQFAVIERNQRGRDANARGDGELVVQLRNLADLRASGVLSEEEFGTAKARLLA